MQGTVVNVKKGDVLIKEGSEGREIYWVIKGKFLAEKNYLNDKVTIGHIGPGELVGELAFLDKRPRSATVRATEDSQVAMLNFSEFKKMFDDSPKWMRKLLVSMAIRLRAASEF